MPRAIIATDDPADRVIADEVRPALVELGYEVNLLSPMDDTSDEVVRAVLTRTRVDIICLVANRRYRDVRRRVRDDTGHDLREVEIITESRYEQAMLRDLSSGMPATDPVAVAERLRSLPSTHVFAGEVKANSTPILVIFSTAEAAAIFDRDRMPRWCHSYNTDASSTPIRGVLVRLLAEWRDALLSELQWTGYSLVIDDHGLYSLRSTFRRRELDGRIITPTTNPTTLHDAGFLIASSDLERVVAPVQEFEWLIQNYREVARRVGTKPEEVFQKFLNENPQFLIGDSFQSHFSKPRLPLPEDPARFYEPDFVLKPNAFPTMGSNWKILDVKLPDVRLMVSGRFHPQFSQRLNHAIQQLRDYRQYFNRPDATQYLSDRLGHSPRNPKLAVLIGTARDEPMLETFGAVAGSANALDVQVITYDELLTQRRNVVLAQASVLDHLGQIRHH